MEIVGGDDDRVLVGCALPPQVAGAPRGAVLLSVPHVLPSATTDAAAARSQANGQADVPRLPAAPLVRVRWWGENRPGSTLFRPTRISSERETTAGVPTLDGKNDETDEADMGDSSIRMRYPVCVPLEQLLDYLHDMKELVMDVVDRATRKKIGRSVFPFQFDESAVGAQEAAARLCRTNALCEIHSTVDAAVVLGYLTVNFEIDWTGVADVSTPLKWASSSGMVPAVSVNPHQTLGVVEQETERPIQQRLSFSSISSSSTLSGLQRHTPWRIRSQEVDTALATRSGGSGRLDDLLEKGRALERSMSKAVTDEATISNPAPLLTDPTEAAPSPVSMMMLMAPYEAMTEDVENSWERVLEEAEQIRRPSDSDRVLASETINGVRHELTDAGISLGGYDALEISFESMELEQAMMDRLRQLREGSVSTRFSPVQLVVSHEHPKRVFKQDASSEQDHWIAAFAVNSSLRKRHWRTNYTHTLPLLESGSIQANGRGQRLQMSQRVLKFRVRCKPQHASPTGMRRRDRQTQVLDLTAEVPVNDLFEHRDRASVQTLSLRLAPTTNGAKKDRPASRQNAPGGTITVRFRFCTLPDTTEEDKEQLSDGVDSSTWSLEKQDRHPKHLDHHPERRTHQLSSLTTLFGESRRSGQGDVGTPLFFGLLIGQAVVRCEGVTKPAKSDGERQMTHKLSVRVDYGTPAFFASSSKLLRLKRSARASLRFVDNERLKANVSHMNAFPLDISDEFVYRLEHGLLILEVWVQNRSGALKSYATEALIGIVKVPLHTFTACTRDNDAIRRCLVHAIPHVGVDQDFPVVDPLKDQVNGHIHVRVAFGSAEQMFNLKSTLRAVVKLQALMRGWLTRRSIQYWKRFDLAGFDDDHQDQQGADVPSEQMTEDFEVGSDTPSYTTTGHHHDPQDTLLSADYKRTTIKDRIIRIEIRVEVRENYTKAATEGAHFLGCEVFGQLCFNGGSDMQSDQSGSCSPRFTLWWDANDVRLNSCFVHSFQASSSSAGIHLQDVMLLFRIEPRHIPVQNSHPDNGSDNATGGAGIDLASVISDWRSLDGVNQPSSTIEVVEDINLPIQWDTTNREPAPPGLAQVLPLTIGLRVTCDGSQGGVPSLADEMVNEDKPQMPHLRNDEVTTIHSVSRTERLLPAALHLSLDIQRISDVRDMLQEQLVAATQKSDSDRTVRVIRRALERDSLRLKIVMSLCLGVELHSEEGRHNGTHVLYQDNHDRWYKRFQFEDIQLDLVNGVQAFPSITQGDAYVVVHPELVTFLQEGNLDIQFLLLDEDGNVPAGTVSVPLSAMLFRPSGVQGSFPVRVDNVLAGRVGVHIFIDQDDVQNRSIVPSRSAESVSVANHRHFEDQTARPNLAEAVDVEEHTTEESDEQTLEQAVASIHEAAQQIQNRLARLAAQTNELQPNSHDTSRASLCDFLGEGNDEALPTASTLSTPSSGTRSPEVENLRGEDLNDVKSSNDSDLDEVQLADTTENSESGSVVMSDSAESFDAFKPITLASFGIEEVELSPIVEAYSPKFDVDNEHLQTSTSPDDANARPGEESFCDMEKSAESAEGHLEPAPEDVKVHGVEVCEELSSDLSDGCDAVVNSSVSPTSSLMREATAERDEEIKAEETKHPESREESEYKPLDTAVDELNASGEETTAEEVETNLSETPSVEENVTSGDVADVRDDHIQTDEVDHGVGDCGYVADHVKFINETLQTEPAINPSIAGETHCAHTSAIEADRSIDAVDCLADSDVTVGETEVDAIEENEGISTGEQITVDQEPPKSQEDQPVVEGSIVSQGDSPADNGMGGVHAPSLRLERPSVRMCETSTQTPGGDLPEPTASIPLELPSPLPAVVDKSPTNVDSSSHTIFDNIHEKADCASQEALSPNEHEKDDVADSWTQESSVDCGARGDLPVDVSVNEVYPRPIQARDVRHALPAEKFEIAWQLLNEIRALYVDPNALDIPEPTALEADSIGESTHKNNQEPPMEAPTSQRISRPSSATNRSDCESPPNKRVLGVDEIDESPTRRISTLMAEPSAIWHWRDAESLKAEVEHSLQASKRDYEEALALSQSMQSMRSRSSSSHYSSTRETAAVWEEKTQELSASALAKRKGTRSLFRVDTETERIARIMQGSMRYWLYDDDDDDDDGGCGETSEDDNDSADNYF